MMSSQVVTEIFPLKELRVRGELQEWQEIYKENTQKIYHSMVSLREEFGTSQIDINGGKILLEIWQEGASSNGTSQQLRWCVFINSKTRIFITVPIAKALVKNNINSRKLNGVFEKIIHMPNYKKLLDYEKKRVALNARSKANHRILQSLDEIYQGINLDKFLHQLNQRGEL
ncbi:hypothetical protein QJU39_04145 [Pasteurella atlantica]|nr:hypothetical protein [Pasteurella atlantica]